MNTILRLKEAGKTVVMVTHKTNALARAMPSWSCRMAPFRRSERATISREDHRASGRAGSGSCPSRSRLAARSEPLIFKQALTSRPTTLTGGGMTVDKPSGDYRGAAVAGYALIFHSSGFLAAGRCRPYRRSGDRVRYGIGPVQAPGCPALRAASSARSACVMVRWSRRAKSSSFSMTHPSREPRCYSQPVDLALAPKHASQRSVANSPRLSSLRTCCGARTSPGGGYLLDQSLPFRAVSARLTDRLAF